MLKRINYHYILLVEVVFADWNFKSMLGFYGVLEAVLLSLLLLKDEVLIVSVWSADVFYSRFLRS
jgi:hypothetical protein